LKYPLILLNQSAAPRNLQSSQCLDGRMTESSFGE
jgi:hypothetical protein